MRWKLFVEVLLVGEGSCHVLQYFTKTILEYRAGIRLPVIKKAQLSMVQMTYRLSYTTHLTHDWRTIWVAKCLVKWWG